jgi:hypothetical protein
MNNLTKNFIPAQSPYIRSRYIPPQLGDVLAAGFKDRISRAQKELHSLNAFWASIIPSDFLSHLRLAGIKDGVLLIETDSPSYSYELFLRSDELLKQLRKNRFPIKKIKFVFGDFVH